MWWKWALIALASMTPNLVFGQQMAAVMGYAWGFHAIAVIAVSTVFGYISGFFWIWLGGKDFDIGWLIRFRNWMRKPRAVEFARKWGLWGGMTLGVAMVGQEPIILALRYLGVEGRKIWVPMILANIISCILYYYFIKLGWASVESFTD
jgi:hypothetical protein